MGNFYVNICVKISDPSELISLLPTNYRSAFVGPSVGGWTCYCGELIDTQDQAAISVIGKFLSAELKTTAFAVLNHDDSFLSVDVFRDGEPVAEYNSCPGYFMENPSEDDLKPRVSDVASFVSISESAASEDVRSALTGDGYLADEIGRHAQIASVLGLPQYSVGAGYLYIDGKMLIDTTTEWTRVN